MTVHFHDQEASGRTLKQGVVGFLALFTSTGTLLCCALPAAIAAVAGGAAVTSFVSTFPWLIPLSANKLWIFLVSGMMIAFSGALVFRPEGRVACGITGGEGCSVAGRFSKAMFWISAGIYLVGAFFAYAVVPLLRILEG